MKNKIFSIVLSALVAVGLWLYVVTVESPGSEKTYYNIPVILQNENVLEERGLMITSDLPAITLTLSGTRTNLNKLDENNINILVNAASIEAAGTHQLSYSVSYPGSVSSGDISRVGQSVNMITVTVEKRATKNVNVKVECTGETPDGFFADKDNILLDYDSVKISGPASVINQITQARIEVDMTGRTSTLMGAYSYKLCDQNGDAVDAELVTTNVDKVNVTLKIQRWKEIPVNVEMIYGGGFTAENVQFAVDKETITVAGSEAQLADLEQIILTVDLVEYLKAEIKDAGVAQELKTITVKKMIDLPDGATSVSGTTEVTITITFPEKLKLKKLSITDSDFTTLGVPAGKDPIIAMLEIVVVGPATAIDRIDSEDIKATVDFTNVQSGIASLPVTIDVLLSGVYVVGTYVTNAQLS